MSAHAKLSNKQTTVHNKPFSMLLASSVHDIKNVLGSVMESVDWMMSHSKPTEEQASELHKVNQLVAMINGELMQLLCIYKYENQQFSLAKNIVNVEDFLDMQAAFLIPLLQGKQISLKVECEEELEGQFDETLLASAIRNAVMNAMKFAKSTVSIHATLKDHLLEFIVEDDGPGYPEQMTGEVCDIKSAADLSSNSTGLGLYFAEIVANLHSTQEHPAKVILSNHSRLGGASFVIQLPQA